MKRNAFVLLSVIPGTIGGLVSFVVAITLAVSIGRGPDGRGVHDRWAGLRVERRP